MTASANTFIGSVLKQLGFSDLAGAADERYPKFDLHELDPQNEVLLFSSEPYPFARRKRELADLGFACALVDGESFSWFGVRALKFLERELNICVP